MAPAETQSLIIVGHGTREPRGVEGFRRVVEEIVARLPGVIVEHGFLELAEPSIGEAVRRAVARGARQLVVAPLLLFAAGHAKRDIPAAVAEALAELPDVAWRQTPVLGCHERVVALSAQRFEEALRRDAETRATPSPVPLETVGTPVPRLLLMVGRGSRDPEALAEMERLTQLRASGSDVTEARTCYLAMAEPSLASALAQAASEPWRQIVVQPHLLFAGELLDRVGEVVARQPEPPYLVMVGALDEPQVLADVVLEGTGLRAQAAPPALPRG